MGSALLSGLVAAGWATLERAGRQRDRPRPAGPTRGGQSGPDRGRRADAADDVVLAVKPDVAESVLRTLGATGPRRVLSIVAGISSDRLEATLPAGSVVVRAMPNTPSLVGAGVAGLSGGMAATSADLDWAEGILGAVGTVVRLPERHLDAVTGISGSGPAYVFLVAEAMIEAGVTAGLTRDDQPPAGGRHLARARRGCSTRRARSRPSCGPPSPRPAAPRRPPCGRSSSRRCARRSSKPLRPRSSAPASSGADRAVGRRIGRRARPRPTILAVATDIPSANKNTSANHEPRPGGPGARGRRIPEATVARLPVYQRILEELLRAGTTTVSSDLLAAAAQVNAAKVRKDLSLLGSFGTRGGRLRRGLPGRADRPPARPRPRLDGGHRRHRQPGPGPGPQPGVRRPELRGGGPDRHRPGHHRRADRRRGGAPPRRLRAIAAATPLSIGVITTPAPVAQRVADRWSRPACARCSISPPGSSTCPPTSCSATST